MKKTLYLLVLGLLFQSCNTKLYLPVTSAGEISIEKLKLGRELYVNNCASCHQLYLPNNYNSEDWHYWLDKMQKKANITDNQKKNIYDYLVNVPK